MKYLIGEVDHALAHLRDWMKPAPINTPPMLAPSDAQVRFDPLGVGLIIGTWNYPVMLTLSPLIAAISGGNAAVIKPSDVSVATAGAIATKNRNGIEKKLRQRRAPELNTRGAMDANPGTKKMRTDFMQALILTRTLR